MAKKRDPRAGGKIKPLSDRDRFNAGRKSGEADGEWKVVKGILKLVKKK